MFLFDDWNWSTGTKSKFPSGISKNWFPNTPFSG